MGSSAQRRSVLLLAATLAAIGGTLWLHWPSLHSGFRGDDYVHGAMLRGTFPAPRSGLDVFSFASGAAAEQQRLLDFGYLPWWTVPDIQLRMWRPLASAMVTLDHSWFGWRATPMHAHSLMWLAALVCSAALLLRGLLTPVAAGLAVVLFALQPAHTVPVAWLANRNTLIATALGFLSVAAYVRYRSHQSPRHAVAAALFAVVALAAGEYALTALAYAFAYECTLGRGDVRRRAIALLPVALPALGYLALHSWLGADVVGSGFYVSPVRAPLHFASAVFTRVPVLAADVVLGLPSAYYALGMPLRHWFLSLELFTPIQWQALPDWSTVHTLVGYVALAAAYGGTRLLVRACSPAAGRVVTFLALGSVLALLPTAGSLPGDRLLGASTLGLCGTVGILLDQLGRWWVGEAPTAQRVRYALVGLAACGLYFGYGTQRTHQQATYFAAESEMLRVWSLHAELPEQHAAQTRVYVIASSDFTTSANLPWLRLVHGRPLSLSYRRLSPAMAALSLRRIDDRSFDLSVLSSDTRFNAVPSLYRSADRVMRVGERAKLPGLSVKVLRVADGNPMLMRFSFDRSLDDERLWFVHATASGLRRVRMPAVGEALRLQRPMMVNLRAAGLAPAGMFAE